MLTSEFQTIYFLQKRVRRLPPAADGSLQAAESEKIRHCRLSSPERISGEYTEPSPITSPFAGGKPTISPIWIILLGVFNIGSRFAVTEPLFCSPYIIFLFAVSVSPDAAFFSFM